MSLKRVVLGLSDGVDSTVAAYLLKEQGYAVTGVYLQNAGETELENARRNAMETGVDFACIDIRALLEEKVCQPFVQNYLAGRTPSPCPVCNRDVKIETLLSYAQAHGIDEVATGHYVLKQGGKLYMGDESCDQSYMLCLLTRSQAEKLVLPLGAYGKSEVRQIAGRCGFRCADRPDSRENCFIRDTDYVSYIRSLAPQAVQDRGEVFYKGKLFDEHEGIYAYTVGQRWKCDCGGRRLYVSRISRGNNRIDLCLWEELFTRRVDVGGASWIADLPKAPFEARIRVRHTRWETPGCTVFMQGDLVQVQTQTPLRAPVKGQVAAFYRGNQLIGGGTVESLAADYPLSRENK